MQLPTPPSTAAAFLRLIQAHDRDERLERLEARQARERQLELERLERLEARQARERQLELELHHATGRRRHFFSAVSAALATSPEQERALADLLSDSEPAPPPSPKSHEPPRRRPPRRPRRRHPPLARATSLRPAVTPLRAPTSTPVPHQSPVAVEPPEPDTHVLLRIQRFEAIGRDSLLHEAQEGFNNIAVAWSRPSAPSAAELFHLEHQRLGQVLSAQFDELITTLALTFQRSKPVDSLGYCVLGTACPNEACTAQHMRWHHDFWDRKGITYASRAKTPAAKPPVKMPMHKAAPHATPGPKTTYTGK
eukprot:PhM_4_TR16070/c2_g3_i2/m.94409